MLIRAFQPIDTQNPKNQHGMYFEDNSVSVKIFGGYFCDGHTRIYAKIYPLMCLLCELLSKEINKLTTRTSRKKADCISSSFLCDY